MIQALLVDDERLALVKLELMLGELGTVNVVGTFTNPLEAVQASGDLNPDVIFLDIEMPELNGIQAAELLHTQCPRAMIVFLTAYNSYAVDAFDLNALDYVLKPVNRNRLQKTIQRLTERLEERLLAESACKPSETTMICCFQSLRFIKGDQQLPHIRWRTSKAQELCAFLIHNCNRFVSKDMLIELLWPDIPLKKASTLLYTTIYQVRQCLKQHVIDLKINNASAGEGYILETDGMPIDITEWEKGIQELTSITIDNFREHQRLFDCYSGDYLGDYDYLWAESERQRLRTIWLHHSMSMAVFCKSNGKLPESVTVYKRIIQLHPFFEQAHLGLMKAYDSIGERTAVEEQYNQLSGILQRELGIDPPEEITGWYEEWKQSKSFVHNRRQTQEWLTL